MLNKGNKSNVAASEKQAVTECGEDAGAMRKKWHLNRENETNVCMGSGKTENKYVYFIVCDALQPSFGLFWILKWFDAKIIRTTNSLAPLTENNFKSLWMCLFVLFFLLPGERAQRYHTVVVRCPTKNIQTTTSAVHTKSIASFAKRYIFTTSHIHDCCNGACGERWRQKIEWKRMRMCNVSIKCSCGSRKKNRRT